MDLIALASSLERDSFIAECPFPMLLAVNEPVPPASSQELFPDEPAVTYSAMKQPDQSPMQVAKRPVLYAIRKVHTLLPHGIVLGRTPECDVVVRDVAVSKEHALFQELDGSWLISDLGSRNGTHVKHQKATPRGEPLPLVYGDIISFAFRTFYFLDAGSVWDRLRGDTYLPQNSSGSR